MHNTITTSNGRQIQRQLRTGRCGLRLVSLGLLVLSKPRTCNDMLCRHTGCYHRSRGLDVVFGRACVRACVEAFACFLFWACLSFYLFLALSAMWRCRRPVAASASPCARHRSAARTACASASMERVRKDIYEPRFRASVVAPVTERGRGCGYCAA